ncbi:MAG: hypothetical protein QMD12_00620 [Candidatus Aenigmarchaeota archaeon]|nr:hypothetical protein [Candidatus Aenigmarchaeota archaeon]
MGSKVKTYFRGLALILAVILVGLVSFIALGILLISIFIGIAIIFLGVAIVALFLLPYYYAKKYEIKSTRFKLKKIKKKEKI